MRKIEQLFFPISKCDLFVNDIKIPRYYAITKTEEEKNFLGVKREIHSYNSNKIVYDSAKKLYSQLTNVTGEAYNWWINDEENQCAIFVKGLRLDEFASNFRKEIVKYIEEQFEKNNNNEKNKRHTDLFLDLDDSDKLSYRRRKLHSFIEEKLIHLDLIIGATNGYDIDHGATLYLIIQWIDNDRKIKYLAINKTNNIEQTEKCKTEFKTALFDFIYTSFVRYLTPIEKEYIKPTLFDIYNKKLSEASIENDD